MTLFPDMGVASHAKPTGGSAAPNNDPIQERRFSALETQIARLQEICDRIVRKHWPAAEREQHPFWIGIIVIALLGVGGMYNRETQWLGLLIAIVMLLGLGILLGIYLRSAQGRFGRQWSAITADGEMFRFLRDASVVLGFPIEMGKPDERFSTHMELGFPDSVSTVETYLRTIALPDPLPADAPPGLFVPAMTLKQPSGGEAHRVYEVEYRGTVSTPLSIRVSRADRGSDIILGFPLRPSNAESRDRLILALKGKFQDRLIAAKILGDIRDAAGLPAMPIPALGGSQEPLPRAASRAI